MSEPARDLPKPRRRPVWKVTGLIAAALAVSVGFYATYIFSVANRRWADMERSVRELREESGAQNGPRPVLRGTAVRGSAWDDYTPALLSLKGVSSAPFGEFVTRGPKADRAKVEALLAGHGAALDGLRKGALRADGIYRIKWEGGFSADIPGLLQSQNLINLVVCRSRFLVEEGKLQEAVELLLDGCQFARDLGYNQYLISEMISLALYGIAFEELRDLVLSGKLSPAELAQVGRELELLDRSFPKTSQSLMNEVMAAGFEYLKVNGDVGSLMSSQGDGGGRPQGMVSYVLWRVLIPNRLTCADAYFVELDFMRRTAASCERSWAEVQAEATKSEMEVRKLKNPLARVMLPGLSGSHRASRERLAHLRLLRVAVHYRATGEILSLDDPFGAKILTSEAGGKLKLWSVGKDGMDGGGNGGWKVGVGGDIVLELGK